MVAIKDVANMPFAANASAGLERLAELAKKVPVRTWRTVIIAVALFWICHSVAKVFWLVIPSPVMPVPKVVPTLAKAKASGSVRNVKIDAVIAMDLLGKFGDVPVSTDQSLVAPEDDNVKITELNLVLSGIISSTDGGSSWAIIGPNIENQVLYKVGEEIENVRGVKVAEVHDLKVRLNNNGSLEDLWLYGEDGTKVATSSYVPPSAESNMPQRAVVSREQIGQAQNIGDVVRFMVATENGKMIGYKVRPGRKRELFDQVGLKADDIVVSVNGIEVNEPQKVREVYQALKNATEANLQVMRDGSTHSIQISMSSEG